MHSNFKTSHYDRDTYLSSKNTSGALARNLNIRGNSNIGRPMAVVDNRDLSDLSDGRYKANFNPAPTKQHNNPH